jgi:CRISPR system Cascade subunit CasB
MTETTAGVQTTVARSELGRFVGSRIDSIQRRYLSGSPAAQADLARLRRAAGKKPGTAAEVWELTLGGVPVFGDYLGDEPSFNEWATHIAMTLYSLHQRSQPTPMHQAGIGLGTAVSRLRPDAESAITRRFTAVATATEITEVSYHARSLIGQLRDAGVGLDYGRLAEQLVWLQIPQLAASVGLSWGREFYRTTGTNSATTNQNGTPE